MIFDVFSSEYLGFLISKSTPFQSLAKKYKFSVVFGDQLVIVSC